MSLGFFTVPIHAIIHTKGPRVRLAGSRALEDSVFVFGGPSWEHLLSLFWQIFPLILIEVLREYDCVERKCRKKSLGIWDAAEGF